MSHRSEAIVSLFEETTENLRSLLSIPTNYHVLWFQGGASTQFSMIPLNLLPERGSADYIETGSWSSKAITECNKIGTANVIGSSKESTYSYIPKDIKQNNDSSYLHIKYASAMSVMGDCTLESSNTSRLTPVSS